MAGVLLPSYFQKQINMQHEIITEIIIHAPADKVYRLLTNLSEYSRWNPFIIESSGEAKAGKRLKHVMKNNDSTITFRPIVVRAEEDSCFEWIGHLFLKGIFDGHHYFHIRPTGTGSVNLIHGERFSGLFSSFILKKIGAQTRQNFIAMNTALKSEAEKQ